MTPTQKLQQIKNWLFGFEQNHAFARYKGEDNNEYEVDGEISMGKELYSVNTDGTTKLAEDGDYTISGLVINVVKGIIQDVISGNRILEPETINKENKKESMSEKVKMVSDSLVDGTEISISGDEIVAGAELRIVKDGESLLPPAGEHSLKSGVVVVVDEAGKITEVKSKEEKPKVEVEAKKEYKDKMEEQEDKDKMEEQEDKDHPEDKMMKVLKQVMEAVEKIKESMGDMKEKQDKMKEEFAKFKKEPAAEPLKRNSVSNSYQFGSGENPRVQMIEALKGHLK